ncbi:unnamed protein product [Prunus brigantina]
MTRTLMKRERCMGIHDGLPEAFWVGAVIHASYLVNRLLSKYINFKCTKELKPKSLECIFLGFESTVKGFKLWDPVNWKKILSIDVVFDEKTMSMIKVKKLEANENIVGPKTTVTISPSMGVFEDTPSMQPIENVHEVVESNTKVEQMDVKMGFLYGYLEEDIYMSQFQGFIEASKGNLVCRLKNSLYRLQQSPRQWYKRFDTYMMRIGYRRCESDCCVYSHVFKDGKIILLLLYVDDILIVCQDLSKVRELKSLLGKEFDMKDLGPVQKILGMEIRRDRNLVKLWP